MDQRHVPRLTLLDQRLANIQDALSEFRVFVQDAWFLMKDHSIADLLIFERSKGKYEQAQNFCGILLHSDAWSRRRSRIALYLRRHEISSHYYRRWAQNLVDLHSVEPFGQSVDGLA